MQQATPPDDSSPTQVEDQHKRSRGQVLVIAVAGMFVVMGFVAIVIDISWYWANSLRVQRAADSAALAGVVFLPADVPTAVSTAKAQAKTNGYIDGTAGVTVTPTQDDNNDRRMDVSISAPVGTFFMRLVGISSIPVTKTAEAEYILAVPMGSPQAYYGVDQLTKAVGSTQTVTHANGSGTIPAQGFWGAIITKGGSHDNGDAYSPLADNVTGTANPDYDENGYNYEIVIPTGSSNGKVYLFDPAFCGTGQNPSGGYYGTGDHWIGATGTPVSTYFDLWNENATPLDTTDDLLVATSGTRFEDQIQTDQSVSGTTYIYGVPQSTTVTNCANDTYHNKWWLLKSGLNSGSYRLQVHTTDPTDPSKNASTNAENMFGIETLVTGSAGAQVHGSGRMAAYTNLVSGAQRFYLAQIDKVHAGKTVEIDLFDPGDVAGDSYMKILNPNGNAYNYATFDYTSDSRCSGSNCSGNDVTQIQTHYSSGSNQSPFNDSWIRITIQLPATYGASGLTPSGEPSAGWWKIEYDVSGGNDTTTWRAYIIGNPVHLIIP